MSKQLEDVEDEIARRRFDEIVRRMINTPPLPRAAMPKNPKKQRKSREG